MRDAGDMGDVRDVGYDSKWEILAKFQKWLLSDGGGTQPILEMLSHLKIMTIW